MGELATRTEPGALDHYEPEKGLKKLAMAEGAAKHFARAKDEKGLEKALTTQLGEQRKFVLWWDGAEKKDKGGDAATHARRRPPTAVKAEDFGLDRDTIHRWRKRLKSPAKFDAELARGFSYRTNNPCGCAR